MLKNQIEPIQVMNVAIFSKCRYGSCSNKQQGVALLTTTMILLLAITILGFSNTNSTITNSRLTVNVIEKNRSIQAANAAVNFAWNDLKVNYALENFVQNSSNNGYFDLRQAVDEGDSKNFTAWQLEKSTSTRSSSSSKYIFMPDKLALDDITYNGVDINNPMKLSAAPQYSFGLYEAISRVGTESFYCMPISILGAAKGSLETTQTIIEINTIPKHACSREIEK